MATNGAGSIGVLESCEHFEALGLTPSSIDRIRQKLDGISSMRCDECSSRRRPITSTLMCLQDNCLAVLCGRSDKQHALKHFERYQRSSRTSTSKDQHVVVLDVFTKQCWCYICDVFIVPTMLISALEPVAATTFSLTSQSQDTISMSSRVISGLQNVGNSCYMNAALQALLCSSSLVHFFRRCQPFIFRQQHHRIAEGLVELFDQMAAGAQHANSRSTRQRSIATSSSSVTPTRLIKAVKAVNPMFHGFSQQDAMDFVRCLLDRLHDELGKESPRPISSVSQPEPSANESSPRRSKRLREKRRVQTASAIQNSDSESLSQQKEVDEGDESSSKKSSKGQHPVLRSVISDTFGGEMRSEIFCLECRHRSIKDELFFDVSLPIVDATISESSASTTRKSSGRSEESSGLGLFGSLMSTIGESIGLSSKSVRLESCLQAFCSAELLEGRDRYRCDRCKKLVPSEKTLLFKKLPQVLILQLKRFRHDTYFSSKLNTQVVFPLANLQMSPFLCDDEDFAKESSSSSAAATEDDSFEEESSDEDFKDCKTASKSSSYMASSSYDLAAVVSHRGSFSGGHYVAYCRAPSSSRNRRFGAGSAVSLNSTDASSGEEEDIEGDGDAVQGPWLEFDDSNVSLVSSLDVARAQAYVLVYHLKDSMADQRKQQLLEHISRALAGGDICNVLVSKAWYTQWQSMVDPGPIDNGDLTCEHGGIRPDPGLMLPVDRTNRDEISDDAQKRRFMYPASSLVHSIPRSVYDELVRMHGEVSGLAPPKSCVSNPSQQDDDGQMQCSYCSICVQNLVDLEARRVKEERDVLALDSSTIASGEYWYLIDSEWLHAWGHFKGVNGRAPPPGPITNDRLLRAGASNLQRGLHYRGLNRRVFEYFYRIYGGGPPIVRRTIDLYGEAVEDDVSSSLLNTHSDSEVIVDVVGQ